MGRSLVTAGPFMPLWFALTAGQVAAEWPQTSGGSVIGTTLPASAGGVEVDQFLGVPFARAERFQPPVDFQEAYPGGSVTATMWGAACMQVAGDPTQTYGSEDCLKANVWSPRTAWQTQKKLPVMVFIYGGSNQFGEAEPYNMTLGQTPKDKNDINSKCSQQGRGTHQSLACLLEIERRIATAFKPAYSRSGKGGDLEDRQLLILGRRNRSKARDTC